MFSATPIPGNERAVNETIDRIYQLGADVITAAGRADPRLRPRLRGGAQADAQPDAAALRDADPRRPPRPAPARASWPRPSASTPRTIFRGENGLPLEINERGARFGDPSRRA